MRSWWHLLKSSWHRSASLLWIMIIALQWLSYTTPIWLEETTASVLLALAAVAVIEILFPIKWFLRLLLQAVAVSLVVYRTLGQQGVYMSDPWLPLTQRLPEIAANMSPYIWFALGASVLLLLSSWWVSTKSRILMFIGTNIAAFAALDSFTTAVLWEEVAWTVFAGMAWLVSQHLRNFQMRYPRGWSYLLHYPFKVLVNIAIIFSLVILTGVNMPEVRPTLTDPYTAWREWNGTGAPSFGKGASAGTNESGTGTTAAGSTSSGYSLDNDDLGGGFNFDYSPVMTVTSDLRTYMRGETRTVYSGQGWSDNDTFSRGPLAEAEIGKNLPNTTGGKVQTQSLKQTVKLLNNNNSYPVLFGAYSISSISLINGEDSGGGLLWRSRDSELLWNNADNSRAYPQSYELTAEVPVIPVQELSKKTYAELYGNDKTVSEFLKLPNNFPETVENLAQEITAGAQTPYEKTMLLQQYLQQTFPYTNQPDLSRSESSDFVESFLFEIKEGYCDYYSTALVTMARSLDIPARWVKGYAPGEQAELPDSLVSQQGGAGNNRYTITNADAHSWAEVYFGEYGWIPVEATPGFNAPLLTQNEEAPEPDPVDEEEPQTEQDPAPVNKQNDEGGFRPGLWMVWGASAILAAWLTYLVWHHRFNLRFLMQRIRSGHPLSPDQKIIVETERWVRFMRRKGMMKAEHETLREAASRWSSERPEAAGTLSTLLGRFEQAKYSPEVIEDKDWRSVYTEALRLRKNMKPRK
ncbi:transglutaminase [Paenibacillus albidus]|uniref:DUF4129 domain-containing transglutaminase family protein n=1 Tax=Paenibacillus albidus TaxID=2041023 RepID=UPI001BE8A025|nr:transglutaminase domain-containing protein [Paenibacillus albidus]MBT2288769.1 transglutaminase [Paenibacillus albidus]